MPSKNPRMMLTLKPDVLAALQDLSAELGKPTATVAAEFLTEMRPQFLDLAKYARAMKAGKKDVAKRTLTHMFGDALAQQLSLLDKGKA